MPSSSASSSSNDGSDDTAVNADELSHSPTTSTGVSHHLDVLSRAGAMAMTILALPLRIPGMAVHIAAFVSYMLYQLVISILFTPRRPSKDHTGPYRGRIAVVGAGLSGVASACHAVAHGFDVVLYEEKAAVGGIWMDVNDTSGLQLNSILYRFFPSVIWKDTFPRQKEIVDNIEKIWRDYNLESRTRFNTKVEAVHRHEGLSQDPRQKGHGRWVINHGEDGVFDSVIVTVGTTGAPKMIPLDGKNSFAGRIVHSSALDDVDMSGKEVLVLGSGASGVEAAELAVSRGASKVRVLARGDKWIIPRNVAVDIALSLNPFGKQTPFTFVWEALLRRLHYRSLAHLSPIDKGIFESTPVVNDMFLEDIRKGKVDYIRGDAVRLVKEGIQFRTRQSGEKPCKDKEALERESVIIEGNVFVMATGYERPSIDFLPKDLFPTDPLQGDYHRPNLYLQNFSVADWSILLTNSSYRDAIGTVGNWHIGIYTRILLTFLMDKETRPLPKDMTLWVNCIRFLKRNSPGGSLTFFSYSELVIWTVAWHIFQFSRLKWLPFVLFGYSFHLKEKKSSVAHVKQS